MGKYFLTYSIRISFYEEANQQSLERDETSSLPPPRRGAAARGADGSISAEAVAAAPGRAEKPRSSIFPRRIAGNLAWLELPTEPAR